MCNSTISPRSAAYRQFARSVGGFGQKERRDAQMLLIPRQAVENEAMIVSRRIRS
jgi:hypothetical protein